MENFKFSYDKENDDLLIYLENSKSGGAVEFGNFVFDFDKQKNLVGMQIFEASKIISKLISNIIEIANIQEIQADIINFKNMKAMKLKIKTNSDISEGVIIIPNLTQVEI